MRKFAKIRTSNFTAKPLRHAILADKRAIVRLGSLTPTSKAFPTTRDVVEINTVEAIQNSRDKLRMKECFSKLKVPQAEWWSSYQALAQDKKIPYPIVVKRICGFQGHGMELINDTTELQTWFTKHGNAEGWYFERFYNYAREYRLHVAREVGVFMQWRKLRTAEAKERWFFNSANSNWVGEDHKLFDKPKCWKAMEKAAIDCITSTGLDIGACDIRVQSAKEDSPKFIVCEINSAPALGEYGIEKYKEVIKQLIDKK